MYHQVYCQIKVQPEFYQMPLESQTTWVSIHFYRWWRHSNRKQNRNAPITTSDEYCISLSGNNTEPALDKDSRRNRANYRGSFPILDLQSFLKKNKTAKKNNWNPNSVATVHIITPQTTTMTTSMRTTTDSTLFHFLFRFPSLRRPPGRTDGQHALLTQQFRTHTFLDGRHTFRKREDNHSEKKFKKK